MVSGVKKVSWQKECRWVGINNPRCSSNENERRRRCNKIETKMNGERRKIASHRGDLDA